MDANLAELSSNSFENLVNLIDVRLSKNYLTNLDSCLFENTNRLDFLSLKGNQLSKIRINTFKNLIDLKHTIFSNNFIISIIERNAFKGLYSLKILFLESNNISNLDEFVEFKFI
jgi:Leucine-rich repeat (LRR) protein